MQTMHRRKVHRIPTSIPNPCSSGQHSINIFPFCSHSVSLLFFHHILLFACFLGWFTVIFIPLSETHFV
ncbi:hypothetical protein BX666DRAFT_1988724, partial [Dichotomocladium elegans]